MNTSISSLENPHIPVMIKEVIKTCTPLKGGTYIDCTFGGGAYSQRLLKFSNTKVIALDRDKIVKKKADLIKKKYKENFVFFHERFSNLDKIIDKNIKPDAIIFDLGLSTMQLLDLKRGFSFKSKQKIDMQMGLSSLSAEDIINNYDEKKIKLIIKVFGEEKEAARIARNIIKAREFKRITLVTELVDIIEKSKRKNYLKKINVCTKTFQALRIFVNKETTELIEGLIKASKIVKFGGKIIVVSFHSIEDRVVKYFFTNYSTSKSKPSRYLPIDSSKSNFLFESYKNIFLKPHEDEVLKNPSSRSAKLRYAIRGQQNFIYPDELKIKFKKYLELENNV
jgi:16S rRNA (cytosine1402-N4)-methyltransferase